MKKEKFRPRFNISKTIQTIKKTKRTENILHFVKWSKKERERERERIHETKQNICI